MDVVTFVRFMVVAKDGGLNIPACNLMSTKPELGFAAALERDRFGDEFGDASDEDRIRHFQDDLSAAKSIMDSESDCKAPNVHNEGRAPLLRASLSIVGLDSASLGAIAQR